MTRDAKSLGPKTPGQWARTRPDHTAIRLGDEVRSYGEFESRSAALARRLVAKGCRPGDVAAIWAGNHLDYLTAAWGIHRAGLYVLPVAAALTPGEAAYILSDSGAVRVIADGARMGAIGDMPAWELNESLFAPSEAISPEIEGGDMMYTSGTTGRPKGVRRPLSHTPLGSDSGRAEKLAALFDMDADTIFLSPAPLYHAAPYRFALSVLRLGGTVVLMDRFDAQRALDVIVRAGVTHSQWVPTMFARMLALPDAVTSAHAAPAHIKAIHAGAPCPPDVKRTMIDWWGPILHEYYSGTESIGFTHIDSAAWLARPGSVGRAWGCEVHILDASGRELPAGQTGNVYFSGKPGLAYHNAPEKTAGAVIGDMATMGDTGHVDGDGYLYLTGRQAFTILSGGVNVYPREIEDVLCAHPDVSGIAVFGVPDPNFGQVVQAVVESAADPARLAADLHALAKSRLAPFKRPKAIAVADLPLTGSGKIAVARLVEAYSDPARRGFAPRKAAA